jgi:uncharacterized membrane protein YbhN (UPF0104 family)
MTVRAGVKRWRRFGLAAVSVLVAASAVAFAAANFEHVATLADSAGSIDLWVMMVGLACSALAIANRGMLNHAAHRAVGLEAGMGAMTHTAAVGFAAQKMVKSAGAVGLAVFLHHGRRRGHAPAAITAACLLTATASFAALGVLLTGAVVSLALTGRLTGWWIAASIGFAAYAMMVAVAGVVMLRSRRAAEWAWRVAQRLRAALPWRRRVATGEPSPLPPDLFVAVANARRRPDAVRRMLFHAVLSKLLGAAALTAAIAAVGLPVTAAGAVVIYATALAASLVTIVPGGFGTVEASTAALLVGAGATVGAAAAAVALFRLFDLWVPVLTGAAVARRDARRETRARRLAMSPGYALDVARIEHWVSGRL